jgi:protoporphyrinogen oxidase
MYSISKIAGHSKRERWGIIGGGMLGMTLAHRLAQRGHEVALFDAGKLVGGLASAWNVGNIFWDRYYHVILMSDAHLRALLAELGLEEEINWVNTRTGFYTDGQLYSMSNTLEFLRFPPLNLLDKLRLGATIAYAAKIKNWQKLERVPVAEWLKRLSGRRTFEKIWLPLLRAKLGETYQKASAAFIWAIIARMYAARRTGLKKEMFGYVSGGYARIIERFAEVLADEKVRLQTGHLAKNVAPIFDGQISVEFDNGRRELFDQVVLTVPAPVIPHICPQLAESEKRRLDNIQCLGIVCASVLLKKPLADYYVTNITDHGLPFTAVIEMSALVNREQFGGKALVYLPKYLTPDDPAFALSDHEIEAQFLPGLERMYPNFKRNDVIGFRVSRARHVFALSTLNYSQNLPPMQTSIPGVHIVNSAHIVNGTLNVNETVQLAEKACLMMNHQAKMWKTAEAA